MSSRWRSVIACLRSSVLANWRPGEEVEHRLVEAFQQPLLQRDGDQAADDRLGRRVDAMPEPRRERCVVGLRHDLAVARDEQAVHAVGNAEGDEIGQLARAHALRFRRGGLPIVCPRQRGQKQESEKGGEERSHCAEPAAATTACP
jgi:hypothetical protein